MKNPFKHFIKHLECKLYINPKIITTTLTRKHPNTIKQDKSFTCNIVSFLAKKSKFKQTLILKKFSKTQNYTNI